MFPIILDTARLKIVVVGDGPATKRRNALFKEAGIKTRWIKKVPAKKDLVSAEVVFVADFDLATSKKIYQLGKEVGALVNVEDKKDLCDFHVPAIVRRGDLLLTVSTGGKSPRLARRIRQQLEKLFPSQWAKRVAEISKKRLEWKNKGAGIEEISEATDELLAKKGWM